MAHAATRGPAGRRAHRPRLGGLLDGETTRRFYFGEQPLLSQEPQVVLERLQQATDLGVPLEDRGEGGMPYLDGPGRFAAGARHYRRGRSRAVERRFLAFRGGRCELARRVAWLVVGCAAPHDVSILANPRRCEGSGPYRERTQERPDASSAKCRHSPEHGVQTPHSSAVAWVSDEIWTSWTASEPDQEHPALRDPRLYVVSRDDLRRAPVGSIEAGAKVPAWTTFDVNLQQLQALRLSSGGLLDPSWPMCCGRLATLINQEGYGRSIASIEAETGPLDLAFMEMEIYVGSCTP